jgi:hypothetical protein
MYLQRLHFAGVPVSRVLPSTSNRMPSEAAPDRLAPNHMAGERRPELTVRSSPHVTDPPPQVAPDGLLGSIRY